MEGKTNIIVESKLPIQTQRIFNRLLPTYYFSRRLKQFDCLNWLTLTPVMLRQIYATVSIAVHGLHWRIDLS